MIWRYYRRRIARAKGWRARGQAVVEFALAMILFLLFLLAMIDLGRAWFTWVGLENAAAEGSLYGMANPNCQTVEEGAANCGAQENSIEYRVKNESKDAMLNPDEVGWVATLEDPGEIGPGTKITVTVSYPFRPIVPFLSAFGAGEITIYATAVEIIP